MSAYSKVTAHDPGPAAGAFDAELARGCARLGLTLAPARQQQLLGYLDLLRKWNAVYNLTAIRTLPRMLVEHLFDCLAVLRPLDERLGAGPDGAGRCIVDVGSGGGLPGLVLAIAWPQARLHLVEPVGKKAAFLRQCAGSLALGGVQVHEMRVEDLRLSAPADLIICRAFAALGDFLAAAAHLADAHTLLCAMKGAPPADEIAVLDPRWAPPEVIALSVPQLDAARHLVLVRHTADAGGVSGAAACSRRAGGDRNAPNHPDDPGCAPGAPSARNGA